MKNSLIHLLQNFATIIAILTSSCTMYRYDRKFGEYLTNSQAKKMVNNLVVNDRVATKPKEGRMIRGKVMEINDTSFVVRIDGKSPVKHKLKFDAISEHENMLISGGIRPAKK